MAKRHDAGNGGELLGHAFVEGAHATHGARIPCVIERHHPHGFLPAVLQRVEPQVREVDRIGMTANSEYAAHRLDHS